MSSVAVSASSPPAPTSLPAWIRTRPPHGAKYLDLRSTLERLELGTVCREARCPNLAECWSAGTATIMLLGTECTRRCGFCAVHTHWPKGWVDRTEPVRVAEAVVASGLRYVVLTQVCRDDLPDGGAGHLVETVERIHAGAPATRIELLIGDLAGSADAIRTVATAPIQVLAHNLETVRSCSARLRDPRASYDRSLEVLRRSKELGPTGLVTKSSIMLGVGERDEEIRTAMRELRGAGVDLLTFGQYLRPSADHLPVERYVSPEEFERWRAEGLALGFAGVESGPLVRSSYHADELFERAFIPQSR
ncbi:MAG: lipoyl synthase [Thermoplasmata archaeon]